MKQRQLEWWEKIGRNPNFGFIILCPTYEPENFHITLNSIRTNYPNHPCLVCCSKRLSKEEFAELKNTKLSCNFIRGENKVTSLINLGLKESVMPWNFIMVSGAKLKTKICRKYLPFIKSDKEVLYAIINRKMHFCEASLNGMMINKKILDEVGELPNSFEDVELCKSLWLLNAKDKEYSFKGIVGVPIV